MFLFLQTHPHLCKECMSLYFLGGGSVVYGAILAQNTCQKIGTQADIHIEG